MIAFRDVRSEMRDTAVRLTSPARAQARPPAQVARASRPEPEEGDTHIDPWMEVAFKGLTHASETREPFALVSCFMNGQPAAVIAATHQRGSDIMVMPLFMAVQPGMTFTPHDDDTSEDGDSDEGRASGRAESPELG